MQRRFLPIVAATLSILLSACPSGKAKGIAVAWDPFPEEKAAMDKALKGESPESISKLAHIRYQYGARFLKLAEEKQDADALEMAAMYANSAAELMPDIAEYHLLSALVYAAYGSATEARFMGMEAATRALDLDRDNADALLLRADLAFKDQRWSEAADDLERLFSLKPASIERNAMASYVQALNADRAWSRGIAFLGGMIDRSDSAYLRMGRGILHFGRGQLTEALHDIDAAIYLGGIDMELKAYLNAMRADMAKGAAE